MSSAVSLDGDHCEIPIITQDVQKVISIIKYTHYSNKLINTNILKIITIFDLYIYLYRYYFLFFSLSIK